MSHIWKDYIPATMLFIEHWLDKTAVNMIDGVIGEHFTNIGLLMED